VDGFPYARIPPHELYVAAAEIERLRAEVTTRLQEAADAKLECEQLRRQLGDVAALAGARLMCRKATGKELSSEECELMGHKGLAYLAGSDVAEAGGWL
jgi:regulator of replication initiation timing